MARKAMTQPSPAIATSSIDERKRAAAIAAVAEIRDGMLVGLGTGSTAHFAVEALGQAVARGLDVRAVATSRQTATQAVALGIVLLKPAKVARIDLCIDGVDEIDPEFRAIKGAGGAMLREKIVAGMAARASPSPMTARRSSIWALTPCPPRCCRMLRPSSPANCARSAARRCCGSMARAPRC
jgi:hypothetical protein